MLKYLGAIRLNLSEGIVVKTLVTGGFAASLISTIRQPNTTWVIVTCVLGVATLIIGVRKYLGNLFESG